MIHGPYVPLSTSIPICVSLDNQQITKAAQDESSFWQVIPNMSQQSLYPSLAAVGTSINTALSPPIPLSRRVINDTEEHQRRVLNSYVEGMHRGMNTSPVQSLDEQEEEITTTTKGQKATITQAETQEETLQLESLETKDNSMKQADPTQGQDLTSVQGQNMEENEVSDAKDTCDMQVQVDNTDSQVNEEQQGPDIPQDLTSRASQDNNYQTAINDDEQDDAIQFGNPVTQPFLSRNIGVPITEVGCLSSPKCYKIIYKHIRHPHMKMCICKFKGSLNDKMCI